MSRAPTLLLSSSLTMVRGFGFLEMMIICGSGFSETTVGLSSEGLGVGGTASTIKISVPKTRLTKRSKHSRQATNPTKPGSKSNIITQTKTSSKNKHGNIIQHMSFCATKKKKITQTSSPKMNLPT